MAKEVSLNRVFDSFEQVRIINLKDRADRRREMIAQLKRIDGLGPNVSFFEATRPANDGGFPSLGARGCFESHLSVLRAARESGARSLLLLEDDLDFTRSGRVRLRQTIADLDNHDWDFFYGAHVLKSHGRRNLVTLPANEPVMTTSFVGFSGRMLAPLIGFLEGILTRPPGSPEFGPMHVDGAYSVFRELHPEFTTLAAFPSLGRQRSSLSDIEGTPTLLDEWTLTRPLAALARRGYNMLRRA